MQFYPSWGACFPSWSLVLWSSAEWSTTLCCGSKAGVLWITYSQIKWEIHRWFTKMSDFEKLTLQWASALFSAPSPTQSLNSQSEFKIKRSQSWKSEAEKPLLSRLGRFQCRFHQLTVYFQRVWSLTGVFTSGLLFVKTCACHYRALQVETVCSDIPSCRHIEVFAFFFSLCTNVFQCTMLSSFAGQRNQSIFSYLLKLLCQSNVFFMPGSGNFFQCVIEGYDNHPFSVLTVDMFIILNVHLPISLLVCIMEIFSIDQSHALLEMRLPQCFLAGCETFFWGKLKNPLTPPHSTQVDLTRNLFIPYLFIFKSCKE